MVSFVGYNIPIQSQIINIEYEIARSRERVFYVTEVKISNI